MEYNFKEIEANWKKYWNDNHVYKVSNESDKPKCYVLDMFPYPSGAGLHVGHPLGYIASDIYARYKRLKGFNVLHPMGFDAFGLPAEQYAIETGQHPAVTTEKNITRYREQLDNIGFCYDWSREVRTSDPKYYKWTQWIFLQLFHSWYDHKADKAKPVSELIAIFEKEGNKNVACPGDETLQFDAVKWNDFSEKEKRDALMQYRLAYQGYAQVWWCEALGTVLANDEVVNGVSERGGHPVERKNMRQWFLRITEYAERLLASLDTLDWTEPMKEMQRNWIGKSVGAEVRFGLLLKRSDNTNIDLSPALSKGEGAESGQSTLTQSREEGLKSIQSTLSDNSRDQRGTQGWKTADPNVYKLIAPYRQELKDNLTEAENLLWQEIRGNKLGVKFRRQHVIGRFMGDFVCLTHNLIVEVDGKIHEQQKTEDALRTEYLELRGFKIIRFTNEEVYKNISSVLNKIKQQLSAFESSSASNNLAGNNTLSSGEGRGEVSTGNDSINESNASNTTGDNSFSKEHGAITVFTTRPDTIFGVDFMVLAPEHELVNDITTEEQKEAINNYKTYVKSRSERERMSEVKQVTGCFTGAYARHPLTNKDIPIWISEYVLAGYGTGAIMAVPSGDDRDHAFAKHFKIPITNIFGDKYTGEEAYSSKTGTIENSDFLSGMSVADAGEAAINELVDDGMGKRKVNYKLRDAGFSRQRYWGEPFPIIYVDELPYGIDEPIIHNEHKLGSLPVELPMVEHYKPGPEGQGPLANIEDWVDTDAGERETNTMPGYAGSSWYFLRYMDPHNDTEFASRKATDYWNQVDVYIGGNEHAVGHLLYSRMWTKALCDLGHIGFDEPFKKMLNQGMIQGQSYFAGSAFWEAYDKLNKVSFLKSYRNTSEKSPALGGLSFTYKGIDGVHWLGENVRLKYGHLFVDTKGRLTKLKYKEQLTLEEFNEEIIEKKLENVEWEEDLTEVGEEYIQCKLEIEKMSKSKYNVVNPDDIVAQYGADTFRMYEMFLGPLDVSKPWDTKGIEGVYRFLKKMWRLYADEQKGWIVNDETPTNDELRILHKTIKKIEEDVERFAFNTSVSQFMICVNELTSLGCHKRGILEPLALTICPFAPHIAEELWHQLGHTASVITADFPTYDEQYTRENSKKYPVAVNGKTRLEMEFPLDAQKATIEQAVLGDENVVKWMEGKPLKKFIFVEGKMINVVV